LLGLGPGEGRRVEEMVDNIIEGRIIGRKTDQLK
jgi:hypothetical protein